MGSRWLVVLLGALGIGLQAELWFADGGYQKTLGLRAAVEEQVELNQHLRERNASLMPKSSISNKGATRQKNAHARTLA